MSGPGRWPAAGFTLIEVMVAIAIFALIGLVSGQMLNRVLAVSEQSERRAERLYELQRAMQVIERDLMQLANRAVRNEFGDALPAVLSETPGTAEFTRYGWRNPLGVRRSALQRVAYALEEDTLVRRFWRVLDRSEDSEPVSQTLMRDVQAVEFEFFDENLSASATWPPEVFLPGEAPEPGALPELSAIEVRLTLEPYGEITRTFEVSLFAPLVDAPGVPGAGGEPGAGGAPGARGGGRQNPVEQERFQ